jgi:hypothetical protein
VLTEVTDALANALDDETADDIAVPLSRGCSELGSLVGCSREGERNERSSEVDKPIPLEDRDGCNSNEDERVSRAYDRVGFNVLRIADEEELGPTSVLKVEIDVCVGVTLELSN